MSPRPLAHTTDGVNGLLIINDCVVQDEKTIDTTYTNNVQSMLAYTYHSAVWTAVKK